MHRYSYILPFYIIKKNRYKSIKYNSNHCEYSQFNNFRSSTNVRRSSSRLQQRTESAGEGASESRRSSSESTTAHGLRTSPRHSFSHKAQQGYSQADPQHGGHSGHHNYPPTHQHSLHGQSFSDGSGDEEDRGELVVTEKNCKPSRSLHFLKCHLTHNSNDVSLHLNKQALPEYIYL